MRGDWCGLTLLSATLMAGAALAETPDPAPVAEPPGAARPAGLLAPAGSEVTIELTERVGTRGHRHGDHFRLKLAEPLVVDDRVVIPAGAAGEGEIVDVARPGMSGRPGKLILAARYVDVGGTHVALNALRLSGVGESRRDRSAALSIGGLPGTLVALVLTGGDLEYPAGARAQAKILADVVIPPSAPEAAPRDHQTGLNP